MKNEVLTFNVKGIGEINVSATMKGECRSKMFKFLHYKYNLKVWSKHGIMNCTYHDSAMDYPRVKKLDKQKLAQALDCILSDISLYLNDEIKYNYDDEDYLLMKQAERGCKRELEGFIKVVGDEKKVWSAIEILTNYINEM